MAITVDELKDEISKRGLSTTGIKPTLVKSLDSAIPKESVLVHVGILYDRSEKYKSKWDKPADGDFNGVSLEIRALDDLGKLRIEELPEQTSLTRVSSSGPKKEHLEKLSKDFQPNNEDLVEGIEERGDTNKGSALLDQYLPDHVKAHYHVLQQGDDVYDATLNNDNKFYIIQALESNDGSTFIVYNRWGRVGMQGRHKLHGPYDTCEQAAICKFEKKFHEKTKNSWSNRKLFVTQPGFYTWSGVKCEAGGETIVNLSRKVMEIQLQETKLEKRIADFISLISNASMMEKQMKELGYNAKRRPLSRLSKYVITEGYEVLKRVSDLIGQNNTKKLQKLSEEFYSIIPHDFGFNEMCEFVIDTPQKLKLKLEMVEALGQIEVAKKLLKDTVGMKEDRLLSRYERLHCELTPIEVDSKEFQMIKKYMKNTHAETHSKYTAEIVQIFRASRHGEADSFSKFSNTKNRMLLWHGSRLTNWVGILSQGLRIAHPAAPVTKTMYGKGVYFSDMFSKSAHYCHSFEQDSNCVLLLCEVALGEMVELLTAKHDADKLPQGKLSIKGLGATAPDMSQNETLEDGVVVPLGHPKEQPNSNLSSLLYNEYVVYDVNQIKMRYVVHVNFNFKKQNVQLELEKEVAKTIAMLP